MNKKPEAVEQQFLKDTMADFIRSQDVGQKSISFLIYMLKLFIYSKKTF